MAQGSEIGSHTPGQWVVTGEDALLGTPFIRVEVEGVRDICEVSASWADEECTKQVIDDEVRANARLIASAPELLAALVECVAAREAWISSIDDEGDRTASERLQKAHDTARAEIAKALQQGAA